MAELYLDLLIIICVGLLGWGLIRLERVYQYPFFMGGIFASFIVPQGIALINNPGGASSEAIDRVLLMSCLCAAMCWVGYQFKPNLKLLKNLAIPLDERKLLRAAILFSLIGNFFAYLVKVTIPDKAVELGGNWTGKITIYLFFSGLSTIAFSVFMILTLHRSSLNKIIFTILAGYPLFSAVFSAGRRQGTATFFILIGLALFYVRRYVPPRWLVLSVIVLSAFLIPLLGSLREDFWHLVFSGNFQAIDFHAGLEDVLSGRVLELRNAAILMDAAEKTGQYGYGTGYWDSVVFRFIPGQLLGKWFKEFIQFKLTNYDLSSLFSYKISTGSTSTGIGDTFIEFSYFGCLFFGIQAYLFKQLWLSATYHQNFFSQVLYASLLSPSLVGITHGTARFIQDGLFQLIFIFLLIKFCQINKKYLPTIST